MAITRLNNNSITSITALPSGIDVGKIAQVVEATTSTGFSTTSTSYVDSGFDILITPSSASSKIFVQFNVGTYQDAAGQGIKITIYRDDTTELTSSTLGTFTRSEAGGPYNTTTLFKLDSPNTTNEVKYSLYAASRQGGSINAPNGPSYNSVIAMEVLT